MNEEIKVRDRRDAGWFWITNNVILEYGPKVGAYGIAVYAALAQCSRYDHSKTTLRQLSLLLDISPQTAMRALEKLIEHQLIRETKKSLSPSQGPSEYDLLSVPIGNGGNGSVPIGNPSVPVGNGSVPIGNTYKTSNTIKTKDIPPSLNDFSLSQEETSTTPKKRTRGLEKPCDPRCKAVTAKIFEAYKCFNKVSPGWGSAEGNLLKLFLASHADWPVEKIFDCIRNRFKSEENFALEPRRWISRLGDFAAGPLDKFGKPKSTSSGFHNGQQSHTNDSGATGHLLDMYPSQEKNESDRIANDERLRLRREARQ